jgi:acetyltransferase-like isoleucine patch superfamily enzyme
MTLVKIGEGTRVWDPQGLWGDHEIGRDCVVGRFVEIGDGVRIGDRCKVEAFAFLPPGVVLEDDVFVGPHVRPSGTAPGRRYYVKP